MADKRILGMAAGAAATLLTLPAAADDAFIPPTAGELPPTAPETTASRAVIVQSLAARGSEATVKQPTGSQQSAFVFQAGPGNDAEIQQRAPGGGDAGNEAAIVQVGWQQVATIDIDGARNDGAAGLAPRSGDGETVVPPRLNLVRQSLGPNTASVSVSGDNNAFQIKQANNRLVGRNRAEIEQDGDRNVAIQDQTGSDNVAQLKQVGDGHTAKQIQSGVGLVSRITQTTGPNGQPAFIVHRQIGDGVGAGGTVANFEITQVGGPPLAITQN